MTQRDEKRLPVCFYCRKPLPIELVHGRKYGYCHGQYSGLLPEDIVRLEKYHRQNAQPSSAKS